MRRRSKLFRGLGLVFLVLGVAVAAVGVVSANPGFPFNAMLFLSYKENDSTEASEYYSTIGAPATLAAWKTAYFPGPNVNQHNRASAYYYNAGDLGFGREMHCYDENAFSACYVTNHGLGAAAPAELSAHDAVANTRNLPTVAMVYTYSLTRQPNDVRFYVYDTSGNLLTQVGLDSEGDKSVPGLCLACHGGTYDGAANEVNGANFLPWDIDSFVYSTAPGFTKADQLEQFRVLNAIARWIPQDQKIINLIDGWYGGVNAVFSSGAVFNGNYIPPLYNGNAGNQQLYSEVVKHYCRGCHMAQSTNLEQPADLSGAFSAVFTGRYMPHAQVTNHNFWSSPAPAILARLYASNTYTVTKTADTADGNCNADCSLREAVIAANSSSNHSIIVFGVNGTFNLTRTGADEDAAATGDLDITQDLTILGNGANLTVINGNYTDRVFHLHDGGTDVLIQNVTIRSGSAAIGGGLRVDGASLILNFSEVRENTATGTGYTGGGLQLENGADAEINQSAFIGNTTDGSGGGILTFGANTLAINNTTFGANQAVTGGAVYSAFGAQTTLDHVTVAFNNASVTGGGIVSEGKATVNLINSIVAGNWSPAATDCVKDAGSVEFRYGHNLFGEDGSPGGCQTGANATTLAGPIGTALRTPIVTEPVHGVSGYVPAGPALDAIPFGPDCSTPSYDAFNLARPRDADNNGSVNCDIGALELVTTPVYIPLVLR